MAVVAASLDDAWVPTLVPALIEGWSMPDPVGGAKGTPLLLLQWLREVTVQLLGAAAEPTTPSAAARAAAYLRAILAVLAVPEAQPLPAAASLASAVRTALLAGVLSGVAEALAHATVALALAPVRGLVTNAAVHLARALEALPLLADERSAGTDEQATLVLEMYAYGHWLLSAQAWGTLGVVTDGRFPTAGSAAQRPLALVQALCTGPRWLRPAALPALAALSQRPAHDDDAVRREWARVADVTRFGAAATMPWPTIAQVHLLTEAALADAPWPVAAVSVAWLERATADVAAAWAPADAVRTAALDAVGSSGQGLPDAPPPLASYFAALHTTVTLLLSVVARIHLLPRLADDRDGRRDPAGTRSEHTQKEDSLSGLI